MKVEFSERHVQAQERMEILDRQLQEFRSHSEGTSQGVLTDTENIKVGRVQFLEGLKCMIKLMYITFLSSF